MSKTPATPMIKTTNEHAEKRPIRWSRLLALTFAVGFATTESAHAVRVWSEDFEGAVIGASSSINTALPGTTVSSSNVLDLEVVAAPAGFTSASGNVVKIGTGANGAGNGTPFAQIQLTDPITFADADPSTPYQISYDLFIPTGSPIRKAVGDLRFQFAPGGANVTLDAQNTLAEGIHSIVYSGTIGEFISSGTVNQAQPNFGFDQSLSGGQEPEAVVPDFAFADNFQFFVGDLSISERTFDFSANTGFADGPLATQQGWDAGANWTVGDAAGAGNATSTTANQGATYQTPVQLAPGESFSASFEFQFTGDTPGAPIAVDPSTNTYLLQAGLRADSGVNALLLADPAADVSLQMLGPDGDRYRLLNNFTFIATPLNFDGTNPLNEGDVLQIDYTLNMGADAASTSYDVRLFNKTDGSDTGSITIDSLPNDHPNAGDPGIDSVLYDALAGDGAYLFFEADGFAGSNSGITGVQFNTITADVGEPMAPPALEGDFNDDGMVDAADYTVWRDTFAAGGVLANNETATPGVTDIQDYLAWKGNFGAGVGNASAVTAPEPASAALVLLVLPALAALAARRRVVA